MELREFITKLIKDANSFEKYWLRCAEISPDEFPGQMREGDWWEQLEIFIADMDK